MKINERILKTSLGILELNEFEFKANKLDWESEIIKKLSTERN